MAVELKIGHSELENLPLWKLQEKFEFYADYVERYNKRIKEAAKKR